MVTTPCARRFLLTAIIALLLVLPAAAAVHWQPAVAHSARSFNSPPTTTSGADPAYPLNHTLDGAVTPLFAPPNSDFETASASVGSPPANSGFSSGDFTGWTTSGSASIQSDGGNYFAEVDSGSITSSAFTLDSAAQSVSLRAKSTFIFAGQFNVYLLSGSGYTTSTSLTPGLSTTSSWQTFSFNVAAFAGQSVKLQLAESVWNLGFDDIGLQRQDFAHWTPAGTATLLAGGPTGSYVQLTNGSTLTSDAFTVPATSQQLKVSYLSANGGGCSFYLEVLSGTGYTTATDLVGNVVEDPSVWKTLKAGISQFQGQSIKLRLRQYLGSGNFDNAGPIESVLPGWQLLGSDAIAAGTDVHGTYVTPDAAAGSLLVQSSSITPGILVPAGASGGARFYAIAYDLGYSTGDLLRITWYNTATGANWVAFVTAADTLTGYRLGYFPVNDFMGSDGYFTVQLSGGGKLYSIADNIARQQLVEPFSQKVGLQIDTSSGAFGYAAQDLSTQGTLPLVLTRYYNGHSDRFGSLGYRWSESYDTSLAITSQGHVGVEFASGGEEFYFWNSPGFSPADARVHDALVKNGDGTYTFTTTANLAYHFSSAGVLLSVTDLNGNAITLAYDGSGRLSTVTDPGSRTLTFAYNTSNQLTSVTDPTTHSVSYGYDATTGDLTTVTDANGYVTTYAYSSHRLTSLVDQNSHTVFTNTLDTVNRVTTQTDSQSKTIAIAYDTPGKGATQVTDPNSHVASYYFDLYHRTTDKVDPLLHDTAYLYDTSGNLHQIIDPANNQWSFAYDASGLPTSSTDPLSHSLGLTYNVQHLPTTITDKRGNSTTLTYDTHGNVLTKTDPLSHTWTYTYDSKGNVLTETDPLSHTMTYTYDSANNRVTMTDALSHVWHYTYDANGKQTSETDPLSHQWIKIYDGRGLLISDEDQLGKTVLYAYDHVGNLLAKSDRLNQQTTYTYDSRNLGATVTDPAGKVTSYTYDSAGNVASKTDPLSHTWTYAYDGNNRLTSITDPLSHQQSWTYDADGRLLTAKDALNRTTIYTYDTAGRLLTTTAPNSGVTTYTYDADGHLLTSSDPLNHVTTHVYDAAGRETSVSDPLNRSTTYAYDAANRKVSVTDALSHATGFAYDAANRLTSVTDPLSHVTSYSYDNANRRTGVTDPLNHTTTTAYDADGRVTSVTDALSHATTTTYDANGQVTKVTRPSGNATTMTYDARGLLLTETDQLSHTTTYAYDNAGRRTSMTDPNNHTTSYGYDAANRQTTITDAFSGVVSFTLDAAGQQTAVQNARGKTTSFTYNALGQVLTQTDPLSHVQSSTYDLAGRQTGTTDARSVSVSYGYDAADNLTSETYTGGSTSFSYDAASRRTGMSDATGSTSWTFDNADRVTAITAPQGTVGYAYNADGTRASLTLPGSAVITYGYDAAARLTSVTDPQSRTVSFGYDVDNHQITVTRPNGVTTTNSYDTAGRLTGISHATTGGVLQSFSYTLDAAGNRTAVTSGAGTESYTLDALDRLTQVTYPGTGGGTTSYSYDANGNRATKTAGGTTTTYSYDDADRLLSDGSTSYTYDAAGNLLSGGGTYTWDWADRLASATTGGTTTSYTYAGDDVRASKTTGSTTSPYLWDREAGLPQLIDDGTQSYVHAGGVQEQVSRTGTPGYVLPDAVGSVRGVADSSGALTGTADYDVYGAVRASSGTSSVFGYTGEQTDSETGFSYLRARYLRPATGRLLSADSVQPNAPGTQGYNPYAYAGNNPSTWTDPGGHDVSPLEPAAARTLTLVLAGTIVLTLSVDYLAANAGALILTAMFGTPIIAAAIAITWIEFYQHSPWPNPHPLPEIGRIATVGPLIVACIVMPICWSVLATVGRDSKPSTTSTDTSTGPTVLPGNPDKPVPPTSPTSGREPCEGWQPGPYSDLADPPGGVAQGLGWTQDQRTRNKDENRKRHGGVLTSDGDGRPLFDYPKDGPYDQFNWNDRYPQIDHICPTSKGGNNSFANACLLSAGENRRKDNNPPYVCGSS